MTDTKLRSMTGFGRAAAETPLGRFTVEIKTINNRHRETHVVMPREFHALEHQVRHAINARASRGKVDCRVTWEPPAGGPGAEVRVNENALLAYVGKLRSVREKLGLPVDAIPIETIMMLPGVVDRTGGELDFEAAWGQLEPVVAGALEGLAADRSREGAALAGHLAEELAVLRAGHGRCAAAQGPMLARQRQRLAARIAELEEETRSKADPGRLEFELAMWADRSDVREELVRLAAHLERFAELIACPDGKPAGRPMEFLTQEIHREVNTLGSKSHDLEISGTILDMKAAIERIREQIQNIE